MDWITYWDGQPSLYVNARHKAVHYRSIADGIVHYVPRASARVLDYGCGEALSADRVAAHCGHLTLSDAAPSVTAALAERWRDHPTIAVSSLDDLDRPAMGTFDLIVVNSVLQYLDVQQRDDLLARARRLLAPGGGLLFADVIPKQSNALVDAAQLLAFARRNGFLTAALVGLVRTLFSDYSRLRGRLGLTTFAEAEFIALMREKGFDTRRVHPNLGHNQQRMAFLVTPGGPS